MKYVERNEQGEIVASFAYPMPPRATEKVADDDPALVAFNAPRPEPTNIEDVVKVLEKRLPGIRKEIEDGKPRLQVARQADGGVQI